VPAQKCMNRLQRCILACSGSSRTKK
jgi:hypothetical protein